MTFKLTFELVFWTDFQKDVRTDFRTDLRTELKTDFQTDFWTDFRTDLRTDIKTDFRTEFRTEFWADFRTDFLTELPLFCLLYSCYHVICLLPICICVSHLYYCCHVVFVWSDFLSDFWTDFKKITNKTVCENFSRKIYKKKFWHKILRTKQTKLSPKGPTRKKRPVGL